MRLVQSRPRLQQVKSAVPGRIQPPACGAASSLLRCLLAGVLWRKGDLTQFLAAGRIRSGARLKLESEATEAVECAWFNPRLQQVKSAVPGRIQPPVRPPACSAASSLRCGLQPAVRPPACGSASSLRYSLQPAARPFGWRFVAN
jgi:hypothetical protein